MPRYAAALAAIAGAAILLYSRSAGFGLFADDFQWLMGAATFDHNRLLNLGNRDHFYRPVMELYFGGALAACGRAATCYHWLNIVIHAINAVLLAVLVSRLSQHRGIGVLAGLLFAIQPAPTEAVAWVSAATELLVTTFFVTTLWLFSLSLTRGSKLLPGAAVVTFVLCLLSHESGITLLPMLAALMWMLGRGPRTWRALLPFAAVVALYLPLAYIVSTRNYLVREGHYGAGIHMLRNLLDAVGHYTVASDAMPVVIVLAGLMIWGLWAGTPRVKFYTLWMIVTLLPFAGFREGFSSRYLYLAAAGFAGLAAEALWLLRVWLQPKRHGSLVWWAAAVLITARFIPFAVKNVDVWETAARPYRDYAAAVRTAHPAPAPGSALDVPSPKGFPPHLVPALLQWEYDDPALRVNVRPVP